jgi:paraquat-inducible protein A
MLGKPEEHLRCLDCDLLQRAPSLEIGESARCPRCGVTLYTRKPNSIDRTLALVIAALALWACSNFLPFMTFEFEGQSDSNTIATGVRILYERGFGELAVLIAFTSIAAPIIYIFGMLYVLVPIRMGARPWKLGLVFRALVWLRPWSMLEVYLLGALVAIVKLAELASIDPGPASIAFAALILVWIGIAATLDPREVWDRAWEDGRGV